jgi:hypothetical protein
MEPKITERRRKKVKIPLTKITDFRGNVTFQVGAERYVTIDQDGDDIYLVEEEIIDQEIISTTCVDEDLEKRSRYNEIQATV